MLDLSILTLLIGAQTTHMVTTSYVNLPFSDSHPYPIPNRRDTSPILPQQSIFDFARGDDVQSADIEPIKSRVFEWSNGFLPEIVVVNGKPDRRIGALIDKRGLRYIVFDLDVDEAVQDDEEEGQEGEVDEEEEEEEEEGGEEEKKKEGGKEEVEAEKSEEEIEGDEPMDESIMDTN